MNRTLAKSTSERYKTALALYLNIPVEELRDGIDFNAKKAISALKKGEKIVIDIALASKQTVKNVCSNAHLYKGYVLQTEYQETQSIVTRVQ